MYNQSESNYIIWSNCTERLKRNSEFNYITSCFKPKKYTDLKHPINPYSNARTSIDIGRVIHKLIPLVIQGDKISRHFKKEPYLSYLNGFTKYINPQITKYIISEEDIVSEQYNFMGKFDALVEIENILTLAEWKTVSNNYVHEDNDYLGLHLLQCFSYYHAIFTNSDNKYQPIEQLMLCYLMPNGSVCTYVYAVDYMKSIFSDFWLRFLTSHN